MSACVFCDIVAGRAPATVVRSTIDSLLIVPLGPVVEGHVLVIPRVHVDDAAEDPEITARTMADAARWSGSGDRLGAPFNLIASAGEAATQSVFHLHVHYVPRLEDDGLMVPWGTLHGERPQDPHRCQGIQKLERDLNDAQVTIRALLSLAP